MPSSDGHFVMPRLAVEERCKAYWVGAFMKGTSGYQIQWETRPQYNSGRGQVATLEHSDLGYRVKNCRAAKYAHA